VPKNVLNPNQLAMFMSAKEITQRYSPHDGDREETMRGEEDDYQVWRRKAAEAVTGNYLGEDHTDPAPIAQSIDREGVHEPVNILEDEHSVSTGKPVIADGHHRIGYSLYTKPDRYLPVRHFADQRSLWEYQ
jgi:hypothetical protein